MEAPSGTHVAPRQIELLPLHESTLELMPQALQALLPGQMMDVAKDAKDAEYYSRYGRG
jgi:hypothetical protein